METDLLIFQYVNDLILLYMAFWLWLLLFKLLAKDKILFLRMCICFVFLLDTEARPNPLMDGYILFSATGPG